MTLEMHGMRGGGPSRVSCGFCSLLYLSLFPRFSSSFTVSMASIYCLLCCCWNFPSWSRLSLCCSTLNPKLYFSLSHGRTSLPLSLHFLWLRTYRIPLLLFGSDDFGLASLQNQCSYQGICSPSPCWLTHSTLFFLHCWITHPTGKVLRVLNFCKIQETYSWAPIWFVDMPLLDVDGKCAGEIARFGAGWARPIQPLFLELRIELHEDSA